MLFRSIFVLSKLQEAIDAVETSSIRGSTVNLKIQKRFDPDLTKSKTYTVDFNTELYRGNLSDRIQSSQFTVYDQYGILRTAQLEEVPDSFTGVTEIQVTNPGSSYTSIPTVTISGDGTGAEAIAKIVNGRLESITVTNRGVDYTRAVVTISGGGGYGATAVAVLDTRYGQVRTYYYDEFSRKQIINSNAGTINYNSGRITLSEFRVIESKEPEGFIRVTARPQKGILTSARDTIITIDETDSTSISTELVTV